ncbi:MAG: peptidoglycan DD-metalloendopeptidase family protein [Oscillospiraceae bacterium]|nr:peptidoglycan DD-metalloendopeptidase family protein [Oscillospiraceae bacterium]
MKKKRQNKLISSALSALLCLGLVFGVLPAQVFAVTQAEIDELERQKEAVEEQVKEKQSVVDELESQQADVMEQKKALDERNAYLIQQLLLNEKQILMYDELIAQKALEVEEARRLEEEQLERYRKRVRAMEENGNGDFLSMLLNANSLGEFLTAIDDIGEIMESDKLLEDAYIAARENTERVKADYEEYKAGLEVKKQELSEEKAGIEEQIGEATDLINELSLIITENTTEIEELEASRQRLDELLESKKAQLEEQRRLEEEARRAAEAAAAAAAAQGSEGGGTSSGTVTGTGSFAWPCGCTYITSVVGYRFHPISGQWKYHSGMDIGCQYGDSVWASDSGTVILAGVNGGYGNCIMIDHNNGYYTLYGHLSSIGVSVGQAVSQGEYIGAVGSTGVSTGPHLHFEIRNGGGAIDFNGWFGGLSYAPDSGG